MGHPMDEYLDATRMERDRLWEQRDKIKERLKPLTLDQFTFEQLPDLLLIADSNAPSEREYDLRKALDRIEQFLDKHDRLKRVQKPSLPG